MTCGIYLIECNGIGYIGQSRSIEVRLKDHKRRLISCCHANDFMQKMWNKHSEKFSFKILEYCLPKTLNSREVYWINKLNTMSPNGMNLVDGGDVKIPSELVRRKISETHCGSNNPQWGKPNSDEQKEKISLSTLGAKNHMFGKTGENNPNFGKKHKNSSSKYFGVKKYSQYKGFYWKAEALIEKKRKYLGIYKTELEAAFAYNQYIIKNKLPHPLNDISMEAYGL